MKMVKSLLLGGAAGVVAIAGAQAADLPVKAKPVEYVKVCSLYGAGFYYIPGTDICLKIGGYVRNQHYWNYGTSATNTPFYGATTPNTRAVTDDNLYTIRFRTIVSFDTRQQTDFGTLRTYTVLGWTQDFIGQTTSNLYANRAFIQFAGFTFGKATSYYDIYSAPATTYFATMSSDTGDGGWGVVAYTAQFGNGVSATLSAEEARRSIVFNGVNSISAGCITGLCANSFGDFRFPDIVGNIRVDQAWGSFQVMGALHDVSASYYGADTTTGHPDSEIGWAVGVGARIKTDFISPGDTFSFQFNYAEGAYRYVNFTQANAGNAAYYGSGNSLGFGFVSDAVFSNLAGTNGSLELTKVWGVNASYEHIWNPKWKTSVYGGYNQTSYDGSFTDLNSAAGIICNSLSAGIGQVAAVPTATSTGCDPDWSMWFIGSRTQWNLTKDFYMGVDVIYTKLNTSFGGTMSTGAVGARPASGGALPAYAIEDQDALSVTFRVHRDFVP